MTDSIGNDLLLTSMRLNRWASRFADLPAPAGQLRLLSLIDHVGPARIGDLALADNSAQPTMTTQVQRLEALGLVKRCSDERDARATVVVMTEKGADVLQQTRDARVTAVKPLMSALTPDEVEIVGQATKILAKALAAQAPLAGGDARDSDGRDSSNKDETVEG